MKELIKLSLFSSIGGILAKILSFIYKFFCTKLGYTYEYRPDDSFGNMMFNEYVVSFQKNHNTFRICPRHMLTSSIYDFKCLAPVFKSLSYFRFDKTLVMVSEQKPESIANSKDVLGGSTSNNEVLKSYYFTFVTKDKSIPEKFFSEFKELHGIKSNHRYINIQVTADGTRRLSLPLTRKLNRVYSPHISFLVEDMEEFYSSEEKFLETGSSWTRGCLLYGPAGTGKSAMVQALALHFDKNLVIGSISNKLMTEEDLAKFFGDYDGRDNVFLIEDIDTCQPSAEPPTFSRGDKKLTGFSYSSLLNYIDGPMATPGRYIFFTTNYPENLSKNLIRPGRIDIKLKVDFAVKSQILSMFETFFPMEPLSLGEQYADLVLEKFENKITLAEVQAYFQKYWKHPELLVEKYEETVDALDLGCFGRSTSLGHVPQMPPIEVTPKETFEFKL